MALFVKLWTDILADPKLMRAARKGARGLVLLPWLLAFAKQADDDGRLTVNGEAAEPTDIADVIPGGTAKQVAECCDSLEHIGVLARDEDGALRFQTWEKRAGANRAAVRPEPEPRWRGKTFVYFARCGDDVKIGMSANPWSRVAELETARPGLVLVGVELGGRELERQRQTELGGRVNFEHNGRGSEWFKWTDAIAAHVAQINEDYRSATTKTRSTPTTKDRSIVRAPSREKEKEKELEKEKESSSPASVEFALPVARVLAALVNEPDRIAFRAVLAAAPNPIAWAAECASSLDGLHGPQLTPVQLGQALRDYVGNGGLDNPTFKHFRAYLARPDRVPPHGAAGQRKTAGESNYDKLDAAFAEMDQQQEKAS